MLQHRCFWGKGHPSCTHRAPDPSTAHTQPGARGISRQIFMLLWDQGVEFWGRLQLHGSGNCEEGGSFPSVQKAPMSVCISITVGTAKPRLEMQRFKPLLPPRLPLTPSLVAQDSTLHLPAAAAACLALCHSTTTDGRCADGAHSITPGHWSSPTASPTSTGAGERAQKGEIATLGTAGMALKPMSRG